MEQPFNTGGLGSNHTEFVLFLNNSLGQVDHVTKVRKKESVKTLTLVSDLDTLQEREGDLPVGEGGEVGLWPGPNRLLGPGALGREELRPPAHRVLQALL